MCIYIYGAKYQINVTIMHQNIEIHEKLLTQITVYFF